MKHCILNEITIGTRIILLLVAVLPFSCSKSDNSESFFQHEELGMLETKSYLKDDPYLVTEKDMDAYLHYLRVLDTPRKREVINYTPYKENEEVLFYLVTYEDGWSIVSPDKRGPIVLCESEIGEFKSMVSDNPSILLWIEGLINDINIRRVLDSKKTRTLDESTKEKEEQCIYFWKMLSPGEHDIPSPAKGGGDVLPPGHWELLYSVEEIELFSQTNHLCTTHWDQWFPYNKYCPPKTSGNGNMPAGCVAISGGQVLKYLHDYWGVPQIAPSGLNGNNYGINYTTNAWSYINMNNSDYLGFFIRDIGQRVGMSYGDTGSSASTEDLIANVFNFYGIGAEYDEYDVADVFNSLQDNLPVIVRADGTQHHFLFYTWYSNGHSFIIDGYKTCRKKITGYYEWVWDGTYSGVLPDYGITSLVTYENPYITAVKMNWGWDNSFDTIWYTPAGSWETYSVSAQSDTTYYHFDYNRMMIHNYSVL